MPEGFQIVIRYERGAHSPNLVTGRATRVGHYRFSLEKLEGSDQISYSHAEICDVLCPTKGKERN